MIDALHAASKTVTLNLFQGPSGRMRRADRRRASLTGLLGVSHAPEAEKWTLKQVQGDEKNESREKTLGMEFVR